MPDSLTTHFALTKPQDGASEDTWGVKLNGDLDAIDSALHALATSANFGVNDEGSANALAIACDPPHAAYVAGTRFFVKCLADNTGAVTLAVDGLAAKACKLNDGSALPAGVLKAQGVYQFVYDGADMRLVAERAAASTAEALAGTSAARIVTPAALGGLASTVSGTYVVKLPGGYMIQGGTASGTSPSITFPVAFSATPRVVLTAVSTGANTNSSDEGVRLATLASRSATGFSAVTSAEDETSDVFIGKSIDFDWIAFGPVAVA